VVLNSFDGEPHLRAFIGGFYESSWTRKGTVGPHNYLQSGALPQ
jgi:hypothetical protein